MAISGRIATFPLRVVVITSNGMRRYKPLSKLPSPKRCADTLVLVSHAPTDTPLLKSSARIYRLCVELDS